jgi:hypothetical protein
MRLLMTAFSYRHLRYPSLSPQLPISVSFVEVSLFGLYKLLKKNHLPRKECTSFVYAVQCRYRYYAVVLLMHRHVPKIVVKCTAKVGLRCVMKIERMSWY